MDYREYLKAAREKKIRLSNGHLEFYMQSMASKEDSKNFFGKHQVREDLDPQLIYDEVEEYLAGRKVCHS